jgi:ACS family tartrate transporter-like MFS transporter
LQFAVFTLQYPPPPQPQPPIDPTRKVSWRLLPLLFVAYVIAYIDRINVGFTKAQLREVMGADPAWFETLFGLGGGMFFIGYFIFEIPSNLMLQRVGARLWIARIMVVWGFVSMAMVFIRGTLSFCLMRFLLGAAEAGFFPGVLLYLTYWYPARERARTIALFAMGGVTAGIIGSPISGAIVDLQPFAGLAGWQWLFVLEGLPAVLLGVVVLFVLPDDPRGARWLTPQEKDWIEQRLDAEAAELSAEQKHGLAEVFRSGRVWLLCATYFLLNFGTYSYELWAPSIIRGFAGVSQTLVGFINALPYLFAAVVMFFIGRHSDRTGERRWHVALAAFGSMAGFLLSAYLKNPWLALAALALAFAGIKSSIGPFWAMTTTFLSGTAAAGGIALINSVGNLGGFAGPFMVGVIKDRTHSDFAALLFLGAALADMGLLALTVRPASARRR